MRRPCGKVLSIIADAPCLTFCRICDCSNSPECRPRGSPGCEVFSIQKPNAQISPHSPIVATICENKKRLDSLEKVLPAKPRSLSGNLDCNCVNELAWAGLAV